MPGALSSASGGLSGSFGFSWQGSDYSIPGFMVWMAVLYCLVGSAITFWIGKPQVWLNSRQQQLEANFRHHMIRVREHSEAIALDGGERVEGQQLSLRFADAANEVRSFSCFCVGKVDVLSSDTREIEVIADPAKLMAAGLTVDDLSNALAQTNLLEPIGRYP